MLYVLFAYLSNIIHYTVSAVFRLAMACFKTQGLFLLVSCTLMN